LLLNRYYLTLTLLENALLKNAREKQKLSINPLLNPIF